MNMIEKSVRQFHEAWDLRDPDRGAAIIAPNCRFEDVARDEAQIGPDDYRMDYQRWRAAFPDGEVKVVNVITGGNGSDGWGVSSSSIAAPSSETFTRASGISRLRAPDGGPLLLCHARRERQGGRGLRLLRQRHHRTATRVGRMRPVGHETGDT